MIVGGGGPKRTPRLAARFASEFNLPFPEFDSIRGSFDRVDEACRAIGREPSSLVHSVALIAVAGASEAEFARRAAAVGREPAELREHGIAGGVQEAVDRLESLRASGVERVYLQVMDLHDLEHLDLFAREILPRLSA